ncbi:2-dehydro-3-deoxygluconokinase [Salipiger pallidus]|uniref:2-dehydro-3-deoxygluconokinase n=1 Tax=Salipiger pallidus TaxID=1775170 RepID=A0A8J3EDN1_9RHOB|nr:sugar kinase [Salipiger pallidus]GGG60496.1 2-dehydro-3-deoxygluconokinase [Salipiger pallidus]
MGAFLALGECMVELAPVSAGGLYRRGFAGDSFNTAWYARRLLPQEWSVDYATCVGDDPLSDEMLAFMQAEGIGTDSVRRIEGSSVGLYMISVQDGERQFCYWRGQSAARQMAGDLKWLDGVLKGRDMIHFSAITLAILPPKSREFFCGAIARARKKGAIVTFDTNLRPALWESTDAMRQGLSMGARTADIVLPSFDEDSVLFEDATPAETAERYAALGADMVAVKHRSEALTLWQRDAGLSELQVPHVETVVDTTAAGDSFAAGLLAGLAMGAGLEEAAAQGAKLAGRVIGAPGALVPEAVLPA